MTFFKRHPGYFIINAQGQRTNRCYGGEEAAKKNCKPGETVSEPRMCPYAGCTGNGQACPPCGLCYE